MLDTKRVGEQKPRRLQNICNQQPDGLRSPTSALKLINDISMRNEAQSQQPGIHFLPNDGQSPALAQQELRDAARKEEAGGSVEAAPAQMSADAEAAELRQRAGTWAGGGRRAGVILLSGARARGRREHLRLYLFSATQVSRCCSAAKDQAAFSPQRSDSTGLLRSPAGGPRCRHLHYELQREEEGPVHSLSPHLLLREKQLQHINATI